MGIMCGSSEVFHLFWVITKFHLSLGAEFLEIHWYIYGQFSDRFS